MSHARLPAQASPRRPVNLSIDAALLAEARELGLPLSACLEGALREAVRVERERRWIEENRAAVEDYNARVEREGTFGGPFGNI